MHYDVMVTVILAFIFISPHYIDFRDKPASHPVHLNGAEYLFTVGEISVAPEGDINVALARALKPVAGNMKIDHVDTLRDESGNIAAYRVFVRK